MLIKFLILILLLSPCFMFLKTVYGKSMSWEFDNNSVEGFYANNSTLSVSNGSLVQTITTEKNNTWLYSPSNLSIDTSVYKYLVVKVKNNTTLNGKFSFEATSTQKAEFSGTWISLGDDIPCDNQFHEYTVDMTNVSDWKGTITRFRLRLSAWNCEGNVTVDYIKFISDSNTDVATVKFISNATLSNLTVYDGAQYTDPVINPESDGTYKLSKGLYTYTAETSSAKVHKNFTVTDNDVKAGTKNINIDISYSWKYPGYWQVMTMFLPPDEVSNTHFNDPVPSMNVNTPSFSEGRDLNKFTTQDELETYIKNKDSASSKMWSTYIGTSNNDLNIPLVIFSEGATNNVNWSNVTEAANALRQLNKPIVWVGAQVHGNEIASGEGALQLISELSTSWGNDVLKNVSVVILPRMNPKGAQYNRRTPNGDNDINRDRIKLELKETRIINEVYWLFTPEVAIDAHEYGAVPQMYKGNYTYPSYDILVSASTNFNVSDNIRILSRTLYLNNINTKLKENGIRSTDYYDGDISSSITEMSPLSSMNSNANALYPSFSFLVESLIPGGGYNSLIHFARRVKSQCLTAKTIIDLTSVYSITIKSTIDNERKALLENSKVYDEGDVVVLAQTPKDENINFEYIDLFTNKLTTTSVKYKSYSNGEVSNSVVRPLGYVISKSEVTAEAINRLKSMGVKMIELTQSEVPIELQKYVVTSNNVSNKLTESVYLNTLTVDIVDCDYATFSNGAYYISMEQEMTNFIALALEPESSVGFVSYRVMDLAHLSVGDSLPYYRYIGEVLEDEPVIPDNGSNSDPDVDDDLVQDDPVVEQPTLTLRGCGGNVIATFNAIIMLCAIALYLKKKL